MVCFLYVVSSAGISSISTRSKLYVDCQQLGDLLTDSFMLFADGD
jgi:hypothetical protein